MVDEEADKDWMMSRMVGGRVFLLVPAHPGSFCCCVERDSHWDKEQHVRFWW